MAAPGDGTDRGRLRWEYAPPRAHPIIYAGGLLFFVVFLMGSLENMLRDNLRTIYLVYALPVVLTALIFAAFYPNNVRVYDHGIAPSRPLLLRWYRPFLPFSKTQAVYPSYYDVTGAFVSPFASSDGKVTQMGIAMEMDDGHRETLRFTPSRFKMWSPQSRGYDEAWMQVKDAWGDRPRVQQARRYSQAEQEALLAEASKPFLPFLVIVLLVASAAPIIWVLTRLGMSVAVALPIALVPPVAVSLRSYVQSRRRHDILDRLSKAAEYERSTA